VTDTYRHIVKTRKNIFWYRWGKDMYLSVCMEPWPIGLWTHHHSETSPRSFKL